MNYIKLMRPKHYIKNFLIFLPVLFNGNLFDVNCIITTLLGFLCFSLLASSIYVLNDIRDVEKDKKHKIKKYRPIASGAISLKNAYIFFSILIFLVFGLCFLFKFDLNSILILVIYFLLNCSYSLGLKNIPLIDIVILVSGFLLRVLFGAVILDIAVSSWLYLTVISVSFYLGLGKRRNEFIKNGSNSRFVLKFYSKEFLDKNMYMFLAITIVFYSLWSTDKNIAFNTNLLVWTVPLVMIIFMRYSMIVESDSDGDPVEVLTKDKLLFSLISIYSIIMVLILYVL